MSKACAHASFPARPCQIPHEEVNSDKVFEPCLPRLTGLGKSLIVESNCITFTYEFKANSYFIS